MAKETKKTAPRRQKKRAGVLSRLFGGPTSPKGFYWAETGNTEPRSNLSGAQRIKKTLVGVGCRPVYIEGKDDKWPSKWRGRIVLDIPKFDSNNKDKGRRHHIKYSIMVYEGAEKALRGYNTRIRRVTAEEYLHELPRFLPGWKAGGTTDTKKRKAAAKRPKAAARRGKRAPTAA